MRSNARQHPMGLPFCEMGFSCACMHAKVSVSIACGSLLPRFPVMEVGLL